MQDPFISSGIEISLIIVLILPLTLRFKSGRIQKKLLIRHAQAGSFMK